jgi:hypothetical protein
MMAMTTSSSISVKADRRRVMNRDMTSSSRVDKKRNESRAGARAGWILTV